MSGNGKAPVPVEAEALSSLLSFGIGAADHFRHPLEAGRKVRHLVGEVDQHIVMMTGIVAEPEQHRCLAFPAQGMGQETCSRRLPELCVHLSCMGLILAMHINLATLLQGFIGNSPGQRLAYTVPDLAAEIESDFSQLKAPCDTPAGNTPSAFGSRVA